MPILAEIEDAAKVAVRPEIVVWPDVMPADENARHHGGERRRSDAGNRLQEAHEHARCEQLSEFGLRDGAEVHSMIGMGPSVNAFDGGAVLVGRCLPNLGRHSFLGRSVVDPSPKKKFFIEFSFNGEDPSQRRKLLRSKEVIYRNRRIGYRCESGCIGRLPRRLQVFLIDPMFNAHNYLGSVC